MYASAIWGLVSIWLNRTLLEPKARDILVTVTENATSFIKIFVSILELSVLQLFWRRSQLYCWLRRNIHCFKFRNRLYSFQFAYIKLFEAFEATTRFLNCYSSRRIIACAVSVIRLVNHTLIRVFCSFELVWSNPNVFNCYETSIFFF